MTTKTYGYARPLAYDQVQPGMLISADYNGRTVLGLTFQGRHDPLIAVFQQSGEGGSELPYVIELSDAYDRIFCIDGDREFEPSEGGPPFLPLEAPRSFKDGFIIASDGSVGLVVSFYEFGSKGFRVLNFDTGEDLKHGGKTAILPDPRIFIRSEGRDERLEVKL